MSKYIISMPDSSKRGIKISGIKSNKNPFKVLGEIILNIDRNKLMQYTVVKTDFNSCFPIGDKFWSITDMFCNACNWNIHSFGLDYITDDFINICFIVGVGAFCVFSKHKINDNQWKVIIYDSADNKLYNEVNNYFDWIKQRVEGKYEFKIEEMNNIEDARIYKESC